MIAKITYKNQKEEKENLERIFDAFDRAYKNYLKTFAKTIYKFHLSNNKIIDINIRNNNIAHLLGIDIQSFIEKYPDWKNKYSQLCEYIINNKDNIIDDIINKKDYSRVFDINKIKEKSDNFALLDNISIDNIDFVAKTLSNLSNIDGCCSSVKSDYIIKFKKPNIYFSIIFDKKNNEFRVNSNFISREEKKLLNNKILLVILKFQKSDKEGLCIEEDNISISKQLEILSCYELHVKKNNCIVDIFASFISNLNINKKLTEILSKQDDQIMKLQKEVGCLKDQILSMEKLVEEKELENAKNEESIEFEIKKEKPKTFIKKLIEKFKN